MTARDVVSKWERIGAQVEDSTPLVCVVARFGGYDEAQLEVPRRALPEIRRDILSAGGGFRAILI